MKILVFLWFAGQLHLLAQAVPAAGNPAAAQSRERLATVAGKVINAQGGTPITKAALTLRSEGSARASKYVSVSGPDGAFLIDRKSTRLNSSHIQKSRMPSSA